MPKFLMKCLLLLATFMSVAVFANTEEAQDVEEARNTVVRIVEAFRDDIVADKQMLAENPRLLEERVNLILDKVDRKSVV